MWVKELSNNLWHDCTAIRAFLMRQRLTFPKKKKSCEAVAWDRNHPLNASWFWHPWASFWRRASPECPELSSVDSLCSLLLSSLLFAKHFCLTATELPVNSSVVSAASVQSCGGSNIRVDALIQNFQPNSHNTHTPRGQWIKVLILTTQRHYKQHKTAGKLRKIFWSSVEKLHFRYEFSVCRWGFLDKSGQT